ncbi:J domain-containing protein [Penaeicola halotolerans]|uniref:J domain-containing protein n=1 Tax=Penaeicola halotolerans TaxID=2793196 RepID=UPI001CF8FF6F|nr:J domain-containing protein [Penaeicola halotolerans]
MEEQYLKILAIDQASSLDQLKRAYREQAKRLHPDRNASANAQSEFILLTEAYEYFKNKLEAPQEKAYQTYETPQEKAARLQYEARQKARAYAKMRYEEFVQSEYFSIYQSLKMLVDFTGFLLACLFLTFICFLLIKAGGILAPIPVILLLALTFPKWRPLFRILVYYDIADLWRAIWCILQVRLFQGILMSVVNLILVLTIVFNTLLPTWLFALVYAMILVSVGGYFIKKVPQFKFSQYLLTTSIIIGLFHGLLMINYWTSQDPIKETYGFTYHYERSSTGRKPTSFLIFENDAYGAYPALRIFPSVEETYGHQQVTLQIETGIFGIQVLKGYEFI